MFYAIVAVVALAVGLAVGYFYRKNAMEKKIGQTEEFARNMLEEATRKAEEKKKEAAFSYDSQRQPPDGHSQLLYRLVPAPRLSLIHI